MTSIIYSSICYRRKSIKTCQTFTDVFPTLRYIDAVSETHTHSINCGSHWNRSDSPMKNVEIRGRS